MGLVSHVMVPFKGTSRGILPESRLAQPGSLCFDYFDCNGIIVRALSHS